jgi:hypothetical protein
MAKLNTFVLLNVISMPTAIKKEYVVAYTWQQQQGELATI